MISFLHGTALAGGVVLMARPLCLGSRYIGAGLFLGAAMLIATPAFADQTLMVSDNSRVDCIASSRDLTRISLVGDEIASVSKLETGNPQEDFSVVNEPLRGDIYLSVPDGFSPQRLSFFLTSKKGYVYKLSCRLQAGEAQQVFLSNPAIAREGEPAPVAVAQVDPREHATRLIQAMYASALPDGFQVRQTVRNAVNVGDIKVQMISEYRGAQLTGKVFRIENKGAQEMDLTKVQIAPADSIAFTVAEPKLAPGQVTTAYVVQPSGAVQ